LARHQIYGEVEAIPLAQRKVKQLFGTAILMESYLCACTGVSDLGNDNSQTAVPGRITQRK